MLGVVSQTRPSNKSETDDSRANSLAHTLLKNFLSIYVKNSILMCLNTSLQKLITLYLHTTYSGLSENWYLVRHYLNPVFPLEWKYLKKRLIRIYG